MDRLRDTITSARAAGPGQSLKRVARFLLHHCWFGFAYTIVALIGSVVLGHYAGPLFGWMTTVEIAFVALLCGVFILSGVAGFFRQPNPYSRTYVLYDLKDLPPHLDELDSGGSGWIWQAAPIMIVALLLLPFFA